SAAATPRLPRSRGLRSRESQPRQADQSRPPRQSTSSWRSRTELTGEAADPYSKDILGIMYPHHPRCQACAWNIGHPAGSLPPPAASYGMKTSFMPLQCHGRGEHPPNGGCRGFRMAGRRAAARCGKDGRAADPPAGCAGRSWLGRPRGRSNESEAHVTAVIEVTGLTKRYGGLAVVDDIAFHVDAGEIFGILGPNGAGKTTAVECMEGLRRRDGGEVRILGLDPLTDRHRLHQRIGVQLQE